MLIISYRVIISGTFYIGLNKYRVFKFPNYTPELRLHVYPDSELLRFVKLKVGFIDLQISDNLAT